MVPQQHLQTTNCKTEASTLEPPKVATKSIIIIKRILRGDFNMITSLTEKKGVLKHLDRDNNAYRQLIENNIMVDLNTANGLYTWNNK